MEPIIYFITHHSINWPLIWHDCSFYLFLLLLLQVVLILFFSMTYCNSVKEEYLIEINELKKSVRQRDEHGHFLPITGKGHCKKKR